MDLLACSPVRSARFLASGARHLQISDVNIVGLGPPGTWCKGYQISVTVEGHAAIKVGKPTFDPVNKVFRFEGVWSIPGGREITPEHAVSFQQGEHRNTGSDGDSHHHIDMPTVAPTPPCLMCPRGYDMC